MSLTPEARAELAKLPPGAGLVPQVGPPVEQIIQLQPWLDVLLALTDAGNLYRLNVEKPGLATVHPITLQQVGATATMLPARQREG